VITGDVITSVAICAAAAGLEGLCAGSGVKAYLESLRAPKYSAPLAVWYAIGGLYYATFGFVLYRLLVHATDALSRGTLVLVVAMMLANALWNLILFRARNLFVAFVTGSAAPLLDLALFLCLLRLDSQAALALVPYLIYRVYAVWWGYALWIANRTL
jgi:tryptophan-rich sensory protein